VTGSTVFRLDHVTHASLFYRSTVRIPLTGFLKITYMCVAPPLICEQRASECVQLAVYPDANNAYFRKSEPEVLVVRLVS
jgi:hypothetical protein